MIIRIVQNLIRKIWPGKTDGQQLPQLPWVWPLCFILQLFYQIVLAHLVFRGPDPAVIKIQWYLELIFLSIALFCYFLIVYFLKRYKFIWASFFSYLTIFFLMYSWIPVFILNNETADKNATLFINFLLILQIEEFLTAVTLFYRFFIGIHILYLFFKEINYDYLYFNIIARLFCVVSVLGLRGYLYWTHKILPVWPFSWTLITFLLMILFTILLYSKFLNNIKDPKIFAFFRIVCFLGFDFSFVFFITFCV